MSWNGTSRSVGIFCSFLNGILLFADKSVWSVGGAVWCSYEACLKSRSRDKRRNSWIRMIKRLFGADALRAFLGLNKCIGATISSSYVSAGRECVLLVMIFLLLYYSCIMFMYRDISIFRPDSSLIQVRWIERSRYISIILLNYLVTSAVCSNFTTDVLRMLPLLWLYMYRLSCWLASATHKCFLVWFCDHCPALPSGFCYCWFLPTSCCRKHKFCKIICIKGCISISVLSGNQIL